MREMRSFGNAGGIPELRSHSLNNKPNQNPVKISIRKNSEINPKETSFRLRALQPLSTCRTNKRQLTRARNFNLHATSPQLRNEVTPPYLLSTVETTMAYQYLISRYVYFEPYSSRNTSEGVLRLVLRLHYTEHRTPPELDGVR